MPDYNVAFADFNMISSIGGFLFGLSQFIFVGVIIHCVYFSKQRATSRVWEGARGLGVDAVVAAAVSQLHADAAGAGQHVAGAWRRDALMSLLPLAEEGGAKRRMRESE